MDEYKIEFYKNDEEVEIEEIPDEYLNGLIQVCKSEIASRKRLERVYQRIVKNN